MLSVCSTSSPLESLRSRLEILWWLLSLLSSAASSSSSILCRLGGWLLFLKLLSLSKTGLSSSKNGLPVVPLPLPLLSLRFLARPRKV